jgi:rhodanese-related sulfurtransferase
MQDIALFIQHHWVLNCILMGVLLALVLVEFINQKRATAQVTPQQTTQLINRSDAVIVDVRAPVQYSAGHIIGAISAPVSDLKDKLKKLEKYKAKTLIIACATGLESARASTVLITAGFDVRILSGGIRSWTEADMPLVKD